MIEYARFTAAEILPLIGANMPRIQLAGFSVKAGSLRLECLKRSQSCAGCGCKGSLFVLEAHEQGPPKGIRCFIKNCQWCSYRLTEERYLGGSKPHLNLYHVGPRRGLMLMTQDHIMPRMHGGKDEIENLQTMCLQCNQRKGATIPRKIRNESKIKAAC